MNLGVILRWVGIIMLLDAGVALLGMGYWKKFLPRLNIRGLALLEAIAAGVLIFISFVV